MTLLPHGQGAHLRDGSSWIPVPPHTYILSNGCERKTEKQPREETQTSNQEHRLSEIPPGKTELLPDKPPGKTAKRFDTGIFWQNSILSKNPQPVLK